MHQARLFNDPHSGANILIASDAIGLGLNFNIRRVIFTTMQKFARGGRGKVPVPVSLVKQISGRAGRRNRWVQSGFGTPSVLCGMLWLVASMEGNRQHAAALLPFTSLRVV